LGKQFQGDKTDKKSNKFIYFSFWCSRNCLTCKYQ